MSPPSRPASRSSQPGSTRAGYPSWRMISRRDFGRSAPHPVGMTRPEAGCWHGDLRSRRPVAASSGLSGRRGRGVMRRSGGRHSPRRALPRGPDHRPCRSRTRAGGVLRQRIRGSSTDAVGVRHRPQPDRYARTLADRLSAEADASRRGRLHGFDSLRAGGQHSKPADATTSQTATRTPTGAGGDGPGGHHLDDHADGDEDADGDPDQDTDGDEDADDDADGDADGDDQTATVTATPTTARDADPAVATPAATTAARAPRRRPRTRAASPGGRGPCCCSSPPAWWPPSS